jgi:hypothetical protein
MQETAAAQDVGLAATGTERFALDPLEQHRGPAAGHHPRKVSIAQGPQQMLDPIGHIIVGESHAFEDPPIGEPQPPGGTRIPRRPPSGEQGRIDERSPHAGDELAQLRFEPNHLVT